MTHCLSRIPRWVPLAIALVTACTPASTRVEQPRGGPDNALPPSNAMRVHAVLVNGGHSARSNYLSHVEHLRGLVDVLEARGIAADHIAIFASDGRDEAPDLAVRNPDEEASARWLLEGTRLERRLRPRRRVENTDWRPDLSVQPATREALHAWFATAASDLAGGDIVLIYVTDHGTRLDSDGNDGAISLWHEELQVGELRAMLARFRPGVQIVLVMSQCFSGAFAAAVLPPDPLALPTGDACGFFSVPADRPAYGCYPEGRAGDHGRGHGYVFIGRLGGDDTLDQSHRATVIEDAAPDIPLRTSDRFLEQLVGRLAVAARPDDPDAFVDELLFESGRESRASDQDGWPFVGRLARAYGLPVPRTLAQLEADRAEVAALESQLEADLTQWETASDALSRANLEDFVALEPDWGPRLTDEVLEPLDDADRERVAGQLVAALEPFTRGRGDPVWSHLERMRSQAARAGTARWRQTVRLAVLDRLRLQLLSIAGRQLLEREGPVLASHQVAFEALRACERLSLGTALPEDGPDLGPDRPAFTETLQDDQALREQIRPARLGVAYRQAETEAPGVVLVESVAPDSAAERAGLRQGDLVVGPPGAPFAFTDDIKRWVITAPFEEPLELEIRRADRARTITVELTP